MKNWSYQKNNNVLIDINIPVFLVSIVVILGFVAASFIFLEQISETVGETQSWIANQAGWFFVLTTNLILFFLVYLFMSRFADIRLGGNDAKPEFTRTGWLTMLFSAGMGIGLVFYGVAEPMYHLLSPPHGAEANSAKAAENAIRTTFLHWGLHAWAIYAFVGLVLAYFAFNQQKPLSVRSAFIPLLGDRVNGSWGIIIDILTTVTTLFGVATSLGLGASQINAGLHYLFAIPISSSVQIIIIAVITCIATLSVVAGLKRVLNAYPSLILFLPFSWCCSYC